MFFTPVLEISFEIISNYVGIISANQLRKVWFLIAYMRDFPLHMQGDLERSLGFPVSYLMDRSRAGVTKSQVQFSLWTWQLFRCIADNSYGALFPSSIVIGLITAT
jgi:hypothetical protein